MKRFNYEDDEFKDEDFPDINNDDDDDDENEEELNSEYLQILEKRELIEAIKLQIVQKELNFEVLNKTIEFLQKNWFWRFKSSQKKLNLIVETYQMFKTMIDIDVSKYQEEEEGSE